MQQYYKTLCPSLPTPSSAIHSKEKVEKTDLRPELHTLIPKRLKRLIANDPQIVIYYQLQVYWSFVFTCLIF